jgi:cation:H+ antiporter
MIFINILIIILGMFFLGVAGNMTVRYASCVAKAYGVTTFFLGFVLLAILADIPEMAVAITSSLNNASEISAGDLVGAGIADIALVVGLTLTWCGTIVLRDRERYKLLIMLSIACIFMSLILWFGALSPIWGVVLMGVYIISLAVVWLFRKRGDVTTQDISEITHECSYCNGENKLSKLKLVLFLIISLSFVMLSSYLTVNRAVAIAQRFAISFEVIGATIFAIGTTLPELTLSLSSIPKRAYSLAIGVTLGTVLEQVTFIAGFLTLFSNKPVSFVNLRGTGLFFLAANFLIMIGLAKKELLGRALGICLLALFVIYLVYQAGIG